MAVIDLDSPQPAAVRRDPRRRSRQLLPVLAGTILSLVAGEPVTILDPLDVTSVCAVLPSIPGRPDEAVTLAFIDPRSGEIAQMFTCPAPLAGPGR